MPSLWELCLEPSLREEHNVGKILKLTGNGLVLVKHAGLQAQELNRQQPRTCHLLVIERIIRTLMKIYVVLLVRILYCCLEVIVAYKWIDDVLC